jgi:hypothetical protein
MTKKETAKVTFYADPDVKKWLDSKVDPGVKSRTINEILRRSLKRGNNVEERLDVIEAMLKKMQADLQFDGFAIAAVRKVMVNHSGGLAADELHKEFSDIFYGANGLPPRRW